MTAVTALVFLVVVVAALVAASALRRRVPPPPRPSLPAPDDLAGLGLSAPRPRADAEPAARASVPSRATPHAPERHAPERHAPERPWIDEQQARAAAGPRPVRPAEPAAGSAWTFDSADASARPPAGVRAGSSLWPGRGHAEALLGASLAARLGGLVAVLRLDGAAYTVELLAGAPDAATLVDRLPALPAEGHPLDRVPQDGLLTLLDARDAAALAYRPPGTTAGALVRALAPAPAPRVLLVADLPGEADDEIARLVDRYADLLAASTLTPDDAPEADAADAGDPLFVPDFGDADPADDLDADRAPTDAAPAADVPAETASADDAPDGPTPDDAPAQPAHGPRVAVPRARRAAPPPPRSVILTGEINDARSAGRPLAFALVTRADAEALLAGPAADVAAAEAALRETLREARGVRRVEPFGDLIVGVFLDADPRQAAAWARSLDGATPPLLIGLVAPAAGTGEAVREAATAALHRAYREGVPHVLAG